MTAAFVQTLLALLLVGLAAAYMGRSLWRTMAAARRGAGKGCASGSCGCASAAEPSTARGGVAGGIRRLAGTKLVDRTRVDD